MRPHVAIVIVRVQLLLRSTICCWQTEHTCTGCMWPHCSCVASCSNSIPCIGAVAVHSLLLCSVCYLL